MLALVFFFLSPRFCFAYTDAFSDSNNEWCFVLGYMTLRHSHSPRFPLPLTSFFVFGGPSQVVSPFVHANTKAKVVVCGGSYLSQLSELIDLDSVPTVSSRLFFSSFFFRRCSIYVYFCHGVGKTLNCLRNAVLVSSDSFSPLVYFFAITFR